MTRVFYQCRGCDLETPYVPGRRLERWCGACGGPLVPRIERDDGQSQRQTLQGFRGDMRLSGIAPPSDHAPSVASMLSLARQIDAMRKAL
jgi:hypothetical protein